MFRLILDIAEINIDQLKFPKIPGIGMIKRLPDSQKFAMHHPSHSVSESEVRPDDP